VPLPVLLPYSASTLFWWERVKQLALVTYRGCPELTDDDRLLIPVLRDLGVDARPIMWDDPDADWNSFDQVVLRSCWDYHLRPSEFLAWIETLERRGVALQNPAPLVRWNADKRYLRQLEARGIVIPGTYWLEEGQRVSVVDVLERYCWDGAVLKPTVSATAYKTRLISAKEADEIVQGPAMVQEFVPEVQTLGEWSLIFLGGEFSHSVRKFPAAGDFRVQTQFGGVVQAAVADSRLVAKAAAVLGTIDGPTLYARVDGLDRDGEFVLMELELIEPVLFLGLGGATSTLAQKIARLNQNLLV